MRPPADRKAADAKAPAWRSGAAALALAALPALAGCGHFWEDVTSRSPQPGVWNNVKYRWDLAFNRPEPLQVLATSSDGDMRRRALEDLDTSPSWWKKQGDDDLMFRVLSTSALQERDTICRVLAIEKLAELKDPRVTQTLKECYEAPVNQDPNLPSVRIAVLQAFGKRRDQGGVELLTAALKKDNPPDLRQAAAASLGRIKNDQAASELVRLLKEEKDVSLKYRAWLGLKEMTGKDLPAKAEVWEEQFRTASAAGQPLFPEKSGVIKLANFWSQD